MVRYMISWIEAIDIVIHEAQTTMYFSLAQGMGYEEDARTWVL